MHECLDIYYVPAVIHWGFYTIGGVCVTGRCVCGQFVLGPNVFDVLMMVDNVVTTTVIRVDVAWVSVVIFLGLRSHKIL